MYMCDHLGGSLMLMLWWEAVPEGYPEVGLDPHPCSFPASQRLVL